MTPVGEAAAGEGLAAGFAVVSPRAGCGALGSGEVEGAGITTGAAVGTGADGIAAGATGAREGGVAHALNRKIIAGAQARVSPEWILVDSSRIIAASIPSAFVMELFWLLLEAGIALLLLLGIVWWTWPRRRDDDPSTRERE